MVLRQLAELGISADTAPTAEQWRAFLARVEQSYGDLPRASEEELTKKSAELEGTLVLARAVQESVADGILVVDAGSSLLTCNRRFRQLWSLDDQALQHGTLLDLMAAKVKDRARFVACARTNMANRGVQVHDVELASGRILEHYSAPFETGDGDRKGRVVCYRDVTEQRRLASQRMVVAERMGAVAQLVASVAHEINNPLTYVLGNVELVHDTLSRRSAAKDIPLVEALDDARIGVDRIRGIVRDLQTLSQANDDLSGPTDVSAVLEASLHVASTQIRHRAQVVRSLGDVPRVLANDARLTQVFINLLVNAAQAIPEGRASDNTITVTTRVLHPGYVRVEVRDTGAGIPADHLERIFDPFFTTKPLGAGTGLGLSISRGLVEKVGGRISVESVVGTGTCFAVELPIASTQGSRNGPAAPAGKAEESEPRPRHRILVIDDDADVRKVLARILSGHDITCVASVDEATPMLAGAPFDAILCDVMMPDRTGLDLRLQLQRERPELLDRVVFMSGGAFTPALQAFYDTVPNERLDKPLRSDEVRTVIHRVAMRL